MPAPSVIYEDPRFVGVNKPAGLLVHGVKTSGGRVSPSREPTLAEWLLKKYPEIKNVGDDPAVRPGIVHRLDRDASGVIVVARTQKYFEYLKGLFQNRRVGKFYYALVVGEVKKRHGLVNAPLGLKSGTTKRSVFSLRLAKPALTEYWVVKRYGIDATLLKVRTHTGRTHQVRAHLKSIGHPVVGDVLYGGSRAFLKGAERMYLHAFRVEFVTEDGVRVRLEAGLPEEFRRFLRRLATCRENAGNAL